LSSTPKALTALEALRARVRYKLWAPLRANRHFAYDLSHSQFGEDMVLRHLLADVSRGTFVDIGAYHPVHYSNTYHFYCRGWSGLNIDANPYVIDLFRILRPRDINVCAAVSDNSNEIVTFFRFAPAVFSTIDECFAQRWQSLPGVRLVDRCEVRPRTIGDLLESYLNHTQLDLFTVDVEGSDERILTTVDWSKYRPRVICFELHDTKLENLSDATAVTFLKREGYQLEARCGPSVIMSRV